MQEIKEEIVTLIRNDVKRDGVEGLLKFMDESDWWTAPASRSFHGTKRGDLARHSLSVRNKLKQKVEEYKLPYSDETITICGLFHDACKIGIYKEKKSEPASRAQLEYFQYLRSDFVLPPNPTKSYLITIIDMAKNNSGILEEVDANEVKWEIEDKVLPLGHGEKSLFVLSKYINITNEEACAIRFHMSVWEIGVNFPVLSYSFKSAIEQYKLVPLLSIADYEVSTFVGI